MERCKYPYGGCSVTRNQLVTLMCVENILWQLTEEDHAIFRNGAYRLVPNRDRSGRGVAVVLLSEIDVSSNFKSPARRYWYANSAVEDYPLMQQKGIVTVADFRGKWKSSSFHLVRLFSMFPWHSTPVHEVSSHCLYDDSTRHEVIQTIRSFFPKGARMRWRLHYGSSLEIEYTLRTFGIDVSRELVHDRHHIAERENNDDPDKSIEEDICRRQQLDEAWRQSEAPYRDPKSPTALFPNSQDIIMGRNKTVAMTWPGNTMFHKVIQQYVHRYMEVQDSVSGRANKTMIAVDILHLLQDQHKARFLAREKTRWVVVDDSEARSKISQSLRNMAREVGTTTKR